MKKNFLRTLAVAAIAMFVGYNVYRSESKIEGMSELALENVEALAGNPEILIAFCIDADITCKGVGIEDIKGYRQY